MRHRHNHQISSTAIDLTRDPLPHRDHTTLEHAVKGLLQEIQRRVDASITRRYEAEGIEATFAGHFVRNGGLYLETGRHLRLSETWDFTVADAEKMHLYLDIQAAGNEAWARLELSTGTYYGLPRCHLLAQSWPPSFDPVSIFNAIDWDALDAWVDALDTPEISFRIARRRRA